MASIKFCEIKFLVGCHVSKKLNFRVPNREQNRHISVVRPLNSDLPPPRIQEAGKYLALGVTEHNYINWRNSDQFIVLNRMMMSLPRVIQLIQHSIMLGQHLITIRFEKELNTCIDLIITPWYVADSGWCKPQMWTCPWPFIFTCIA